MLFFEYDFNVISYDCHTRRIFLEVKLTNGPCRCISSSVMNCSKLHGIRDIAGTYPVTMPPLSIANRSFEVLNRVEISDIMDTIEACA
jgi:hypothetical protein